MTSTHVLIANNNRLSNHLLIPSEQGQRHGANGDEASSPCDAVGRSTSHVHLGPVQQGPIKYSIVMPCHVTVHTVNFWLPPQACVVLPSQGRLHAESASFTDRLESDWAHQHSLRGL